MTTVQNSTGIPLSFLTPSMSAANASATLAISRDKETSFTEDDSSKGVRIDQVVVRG